jgi:hypothetical protein
MARNPYQKPPGLLGEFADYIYAASPRPVAEIALAGAIGFMAGVCGRAYNVSGTGLNQYVLYVAKTGTGKSAPRGAINRFMAHAQSDAWHVGNIPNAMPNLSEYIGPGEFSSGQALLKQFGRSRSFVSILGEFGLTMKRLTHPRASSAEIMLRRVLLDLYDMSGQGQLLQPMVYSDAAKNTEATESPAITILCESTPETIYGQLDESLIADGLLPRFLTVTYAGPRPKQSVTHYAALPTSDMMHRFAALFQKVAYLNSHNAVEHVQVAADAHAFIGPQGEVDTYADDQINAPGQLSAVSELWNRAHLKALKLAALVAVGENPEAPMVTLANAHWAYGIVKAGIEDLAHRFEAGEVGDQSRSETVQVQKVREVCLDYMTKPWAEISKYNVGRPEYHERRIIPWSYLAKRLSNVAAFKGGYRRKIDEAMLYLRDCGEFCEIPKMQIPKKVNSQARYFIAGDEHEIFRNNPFAGLFDE